MSFPPAAPPDPSLPSPPHREPRLLTRREGFVVDQPDASRRDARTWDRKPSSPRRPRTPVVLRTFLALLVLCTLALFATALWLRHAMRASLPQIDGNLHAAGLSAPVAVHRDAHGVPSIDAANLDDLLFAQGFVTAQDRLWQMDALRRHAAGELAEILGSRLVDHDRTQRTLQIRATADRAIAALPPDQLHQLDDYARGVNAFLDANAGNLPVEFRLLHYKPAPWTPRDTLLVSLTMAQDLSTEFPTKLKREALSAHLPAALLRDLYPVGSWRDHPPSEIVPDLTSPRPEIEQIPLDPSQSRLAPRATPQDLLAANLLLSLQTCEGCRSGSNNWAVAGARSASGMPLVSNDMHLALGVPAIWYEAALHSADGALDVAGLTLPGAPFVVVGRNAHVAWGFTNLGADVQDVYIEHLRSTGSTTEYQRPDGSWSPVEHHAERIHVRGGSDISLDVRSTAHTIGSTQLQTPIISPLYPTESRTLSLAWTAFDPANVTSTLLAANAAKDGAALTAAFATFGGPTLNLIYADDQNHIGYHAIGRIPIRGLGLHHPILAQPDTTPDPDATPAPADEDDEQTFATPADLPAPVRPVRTVRPVQTLRTGGQGPLPLFREATYRPRRRTRTRQPAASTRPQPGIHNPEPASDIPPPAPPLNYTIGSPIPAVPVDALDPNVQWSGYIPYADLPAVIDPQSGFLATANARITPDGYPYAIALNWASPYRVERISRLLANSTGLTPADMLRIQMDVHSEFDLALARRMAYALDHSRRSSPRLHAAADILRRWDGEVAVDAPAPAIVAAARAELINLLLTAQIKAHDQASAQTSRPEDIARLYSWSEQGYALEQLVLHTPARWLPQGYADWNDLLSDAVDRGLTTAHAPANLATWSYSRTHPVELAHPLLSNLFLEILLGVRTGSGPRVIGGDTSTIKATSHAFGPSERFTADLSSPAAATSNIPTGQSANPASPWYLDQLPHWLDGTTLTLRAEPAHTLALTP